LYCGPHFSSLWDAENIKFGRPAFLKSKNIENNKQKIFDWLKQYGHNLTVFNVLGGEPLYQRELDQCLDLFEQYPAPELKLQIFTNLNAKLERVQNLVERVKNLIDQKKLKEFEITASLDCWGAPQEYVRYPLDLAVWEKNFEYLVDQPWINLIINSTVTPLTIKTLPDLLHRINKWSQSRKIYHYQNSVNNPTYLLIDLFGDIFQEDFDRALTLKPDITIEDKSNRLYLEGIAKQSSYTGINLIEIQRLFNFLNDMDHRRNTSWPQVFPWLVEEFSKYDLKI
jgi:organic radical activating enzyme